MSSAPFHFRRRAPGRAASPPTWACYEQIPYDDDDDYSESDSESCSEDDEDYRKPLNNNDSRSQDSQATESDSEDSVDHAADAIRPPHEAAQDSSSHSEDEREEGARHPAQPVKVDIKGKQRAVDPPVLETPKHQRRRRQRRSSFNLRPILTIQRSQGFVWNQDLFVPPYIKDRYVASTSPPTRGGPISCSGAGDNYEVEVVEIRISEGELQRIIP